jgi:hypothetical protein
LTTPRAAYLDPAARVTITSVGNDSGITFAVAGIGVDGESSETETVTGANASTVSTTKLFRRIFSITSSGAAAGNVSAGTNGYVATMDKPRRVLITSAGNDSGITWTITGTDWNNAPISEVLTGGNTAAVASLLDYATVAGIKASAAAASTVTVGTNGVAGSRPIGLDQMGLSPTALQVTVSGTVNYTVQQTLDDPNRVGLSSVAWVNHPDSALVAATGTVQGNYAYQPQLTRIVLNSGTVTQSPGTTRTGNANGTVTVTNTATGARTVTRPEVGVPYVLPDGRSIINNGDGSYSTINPDGTTVRNVYAATPSGAGGVSEFLSSVPPVAWIALAGLVALPLLTRRQR